MRMCTYKDISYNLKRRDRKTISICIERDSSVSVIAPQRVSVEKLNNVIEHKRYWIYKALAEQVELNRTRIQREVVN